MPEPRSDEIRRVVRETYGKIAKDGTAGCGCSCTPSTLGYSEADVRNLPEGANMALGSGNPLAVAALQPGETVLDLGSGGGVDCFIAAQQVGETGRVIGVDMTPEMVSKARQNAEKAGYTNLEFRLGEIEHLPAADASVDVIISNCVINLSPNKPDVFRDAYRVLKPGGRLAISDIVATTDLPDEVREDLGLYAACISGAATVAQLQRMLSEAGFQGIRIRPKDESREAARERVPGRKIEGYVVAATIEAVRPEN
jgi:SAM-dependent methyltransferase